MSMFSAHDAKQKFGKLLNLVKKTPVFIHKYNRPAAVLITVKQFEEFKELQRLAFRSRVAGIITEMEQERGDFDEALVRKLSTAVLAASR